MHKRFNRHSLLALLLLGLACYAPVITYPFFVVDDPSYVTRNSILQDNSVIGILWAFTTNYYGNWCPLTWLSLIFDRVLFGDWAGGFHLTSVLMHIGTSMALFLLLADITKKTWASLSVAALFLIHPNQAETVVWISSRKDVLAGFCWTAALLAYVRFTRTQKTRNLALCFAMFAAGLMAKASLIMLPPVLILLDWALSRNDPKRTVKWLEKVPFFAVAAIIAMVNAQAQRSIGATETYETLGYVSSLMTAIENYGWYLIQLLFPIGHTFPYPRHVSSPADAALTAACLITLTGIVLRFRSTHPMVLFGWLWFLLALIPYAQFFPVGYQNRADRWAYIPSMGLFIVLVWVAAPLMMHWGSRLTAACTATFLGVTAVLGIQQVHIWSSPDGILRRSIALYPDNPLAHLYLGASLINSGDISAARDHTTTAWKLSRRSFALDQLIDIERRAGHIEAVLEHAMLLPLPLGSSAFEVRERARIAYLLGSEELLRNRILETQGVDPLVKGEHLFNDAIRQDGKDFSAWHGLGLVYLRQRRYNDSIRVLNIALSGTSRHFDILCALGFAYYKSGKLSDAEAYFHRASELDPSAPDVRTNQANTALRSGNTEQAVRFAQEALRINERFAPAWTALGNAQLRRRSPAEAVRAFNKAIENFPQSAASWNGKGVGHFQLKDLENARSALKRAEELDPSAADVRMNLGFVSESEGNQEEAKRYFSQALVLDPELQPAREALRRLDNNLKRSGIRSGGLT